MSGGFRLDRSRALWNRSRLDIESDEVLAQILDRGEVEAWRELYRLAAGDAPEAARLRRRIVRVCRETPLALPHFFIAAMASLGHPVDPYPDLVPAENADATA